MRGTDGANIRGMSETNTQLRAHVLDPALMDEDVRPQDDFYRYINGTWIRDHVIPADRASDGAFLALRDLSEERARKIAEEAAQGSLDTPEARRIGVLYSQFMDQDHLDELGSAPIQGLLGAVDDTKSHEDLAALLGTLARNAISGFFGVGVSADMNDTSKYTVYFEQSGLGLPDESYYREEEYEKYRTKYVAHIAKILNLAAVVPADEADAAALKVMDFETALAAHHWDVVKSREVEAQNNPRTWSEVTAENPGFAWQAWDDALGVDLAGQSLNVSQPDYLQSASALWRETDLAVLKLWLAREIVDDFSPYLSEDFAKESFDFYSHTLAGVQQMRPRWKRALSMVEGVVGFDMGRLYVERHFPSEYKERMGRLVENLLAAYRDSIRELDWMGDDTKSKALEKLDTFTPKIGYPENPRRYDGLEISADATLVENLMASATFDFEWEFTKLGKPVDRSEWLMTPQTVNAYYYPSMNEIVFPAAILQPPFFDPQADDAVNYAAIGAVIGHEIGHGFDDQGSQFDARGEVNNWWTDLDRAEFEKRTKALISQYDAFSPTGLGDEHHVNGALTIGENIGDLGGLTIAWKAWEKALAEKGIASARDDEVIDSLTGPERFFASWARIWRGKQRDDWAIQLLAIDPHSPGEFRCNGVLANFDEFADYYQVQPGDALWIAPGDRVRIW